MEASNTNLTQFGSEVVRQFDHLAPLAAQCYDKSLSQYQPGFDEERDRFDLLATNLGLHKLGHGSLDYRLRESGLLQSAVRRLLQDLVGSLTEGETAAAIRSGY